MSERLTIIVPDRLAKRARESGNASKWFAAAGARLVVAEDYLAAGMQHMARAGITVTDEGVVAAGAVLDAAQRRLSPEARSALRRGPQAYREFLAAQKAAATDAA